MEKTIAELKQLVSFKDTTDVGDIVLVFIDNPQVIVYGLITNIARDNSRRDEWWQVDINLLTIPLQVVSWTLREPQFTGQEIFTMGGEKRFIKAVDFAAHKVGNIRVKKENTGGKVQAKRRLKLVK